MRAELRGNSDADAHVRALDLGVAVSLEYVPKQSRMRKVTENTHEGAAAQEQVSSAKAWLEKPGLLFRPSAPRCAGLIRFGIINAVDRKFRTAMLRPRLR